MVKNNKKIAIVVILFVVIFGGFLFRNQIRTGMGVLYGLLFQREIKLDSQEKKDELNVLLMGIGGGTHDGPELTDTVILANIDLKHKKVNLISLPRDLWVPELQAKLNTAYVYGQNKNNRGLELSKAVVEKITGVNPDYAVVVDFDGFVKTVDLLGGIQVDVAHTLDDYHYPVEGKEEDLCGHSEDEVKEFVASGPAEMDQWDYFSCRYKHIHVDQGKQEMNGQQALEFTRSRHGVGSEGSDFARSQRQQEVIRAIKGKVLSLGMLLNPVKIFNIYNVVKANINTDIPDKEYDDFIKVAKEMQNADINSYVLTIDQDVPGTSGLLESPNPSAEYRFQYVLIPRMGSNNYTEIHKYIECIKEGNICEVGENGIIVNPSPSISLSPTVKK
jgi:LCP family protein required for cell wall assembly